MESILTSIKKPLGIAAEQTDFDDDIVMYINTVFAVLTQIGAGPSEGYAIQSASNTWDEYTENVMLMSLVKSYIEKKVRMVFDPPTSSAHMDALKSAIDELEWRIHVTVETGLWNSKQ